MIRYFKTRSENWTLQNPRPVVFKRTNAISQTRGRVYSSPWSWKKCGYMRGNKHCFMRNNFVSNFNTVQWNNLKVGNIHTHKTGWRGVMNHPVLDDGVHWCKCMKCERVSSTLIVFDAYKLNLNLCHRDLTKLVSLGSFTCILVT